MYPAWQKQLRITQNMPDSDRQTACKLQPEPHTTTHTQIGQKPTAVMDTNNSQ